MNRRTLTGISVIAIVLMLTLAGCRVNDSASNEVIHDTKARLERLKYKSDDAVFWNSADRVSKLIASTIEEDGTYSVSFELSYQDGTEIVLEDFYTENLPCTNGKVIPSRIAYDLAVSDPVDEAHQGGKSVEITGVILKWAEVRDEEQVVFSACDFTGDGVWDYVADEALIFANADSAIPVKHADGRPVSIDEIESKRVELVREYEPLQLSELAILALES